MSQAISHPAFDELERLLGLLVTEQRKLHALLVQQRQAMTKLDHRGIERLVSEQEQVRSRIASAETRRRSVTVQVARDLRMNVQGEPSISQLMAATPEPLRRARLQVVRDELRQTLQLLAEESHVTGRLAGAVLGHLNTALRVLQSAMRDAGTYTRSGAPRMGGRLGAVEAVG